MTEQTTTHACITLNDIQAVYQVMQTAGASDDEKDAALNGLLERAKGCTTCEAQIKAHLEQ